MAKINRFILEYKESLKESGLVVEEGGKLNKATIQRFVHLFSDVADSRIEGMIDYPLVEVVLITFLAVLGNAATWVDVAAFGESKKRWLKKFLRLKNGIPSHDTFRRVFSLIDPTTLQQATVNYLMESIDNIRRSQGLKPEGYRQICVDGKEARGTGRKYNTREEVRNLQELHVYDATNSICLYSQNIDTKTNEIPVAQDILKGLQLKGCIVTFDALHTQRATIGIIAGNKGDYVGGLKGNQGGLLEAVAGVFTDKKKDSIKSSGGGFYETVEKAHNKIERRSFYLAKAGFGKDEWTNLKSVVLYEKYTYDVVTGKETNENLYYITSLKDIELIADAIRSHWEIEVNLHWHLDFSFGEDDNTTMDKNAFLNLSLINKMALSLCKIMQPLLKGYSIRTIRKAFSWNYEENLALLLKTFDNHTIIDTSENACNLKK